MKSVKPLGAAVAAVLALALMVPGGAEARNGWIAEGAIVGEPAGGFSWGPSPPYYPYYHFGQYGIPVGWSAAFRERPAYGCHREEVWTGRHWRHVRVCD